MFGNSTTTSHSVDSSKDETGKRVKSVFSNDMLSHVWAQRTQDFGRTSNGNFSFYGDVLYSYREPIARFIETPRGVIVLHRNETFSVTTSRHQSDAWSASSQYRRFSVPDIGNAASWGCRGDLKDARHDSNLSFIRPDLDKLANMAKTIRFTNYNSAPYYHKNDERRYTGEVFEGYKGSFRAEYSPSHDSEGVYEVGPDGTEPRFIINARESVEGAIEYAETFGLTYDSATDIVFVEAALALFRERRAAYDAPGAVEARAAKQAKAKAERERKAVRDAERQRKADLAAWRAHARKTTIPAIRRALEKPEECTGYQFLLAHQALIGPLRCHVLGSRKLWDAFAVRTEEMNRIRMAKEISDAAAKRQADKIEREAKLEEAKASWLRGMSVNGYGLKDENGGALLRVRGNELETSQGATVPLAHAIRAFRFLKLCNETGREWRSNGKTIHVGHFNIDHITPAFFKAGCHTIYWGEVERIAKAIGVFDKPADESALTPSI